MQNNKNKETLEIYVLGDDFKYYENLKYLPLTSYPSNIQSALIVYSLRGTAKISVHEDVHWIQPDELIILLPGQFVSFSEPSEDFLTVTMVISSSMFGDALSGVPRFSPHFFFYMRSHYYYPQNERDVLRIYNYLGMIKDKVMSTDAYRRELIIHLLRYLYLELFNAYEKESMLVNTRKDTRKEELANKFFSLIMKHFKENKDVAFYADKLCITQNYLNEIVTSTKGISAKQYIRNKVMDEAKRLLTYTDFPISDIAFELHFSTVSYFIRSFRQYTGTTPLLYRRTHKP